MSRQYNTTQVLRAVRALSFVIINANDKLVIIFSMIFLWWYHAIYIDYYRQYDILPPMFRDDRYFSFHLHYRIRWCDAAADARAAKPFLRRAYDYRLISRQSRIAQGSAKRIADAARLSFSADFIIWRLSCDDIVSSTRCAKVSTG